MRSGCWIAITCSLLLASGAAPTMAAEDAGKADTLLAGLTDRAVGLTAAVAGPDGILWTGAVGMAAAGEGVAASPETRMRLYSLAKPMTAVATARLMERGRLDPDAPVQRTVPEFPDKEHTITPMHLATHTGGIRHYADESEARSRRHCDSVDEALEIFADDPLLHPPGERETYSSWGYVLLSAVLEGATGVSYETAMGRLVFDPAGMSSLAIEDPGDDIPHLSHFYEEVAAGEFVPAETVDNTCKWGAGAWVGTAEDVARFGIAMIDGTLLSPGSEQLFLRGEPVYRAQGWSAGGMAFLIVDDEHEIAVALLSNAVGESLGPELQRAVGRLHETFTRDDQTDEETGRTS